MAEKLSAYLAEWRGRQWEWGVSDCCTFVADRVLEVTGIDLMVEYRGDYASEEDAEAFISEGGGLAQMLREAAEGLGPIPEAAVLRFRNGTEVGGLVAEGWAHWFSPKGVHSWRLARVDVELLG